MKTLELLVSQHEKDIKKKDAVLAKQKLELDKQAEVAALIHKLSGNKWYTSTFLPSWSVYIHTLNVEYVYFQNIYAVFYGT